jgi:hypothetical protein
MGDFPFSDQGLIRNHLDDLSINLSTLSLSLSLYFSASTFLGRGRRYFSSILCGSVPLILKKSWILDIISLVYAAIV